MKESLTPGVGMPYPIKAMESGENPSGGSPKQSQPRGDRPFQAEGNPATQTTKGGPKLVSPEEVRKALKEYNRGRVLTADERQTQRVMTEMGLRPMAGGAPDINLDGITDLAIRDLGNQQNEFLSATGETPQSLWEARRIVLDTAVRPEQEAQKRLLVQRINERIAQRRQPPEERDPEGSKIEGVKEKIKRLLEQRRVNQERGIPPPDDIQEYSELMKQVEDFFKDYPAVEASGIRSDLLELASFFKELRENLINRILFRAYEDTTETNDYRESMTLYAQSNLDALLGYLSRTDPKQYNHFLSLRTAASLFHGMNALVRRGDISQLVRTAEAINYQHFTQMKEIEGVGDVMRLYDEKYQEFLAKNERISTEDYEELKKEVENSFRALNETGLARSEYENERTGTPQKKWKMEEWEIQRALNVGRTFFNLTFRSAERIATGQIPVGAQRFAGFPMEQASRLMNWFWTSERFGIAEPRGGVDFINRMKRNFHEFLEFKKRKLGKNEIVEFGGMKTNSLEDAGMFSTSGVYSSWRIETMLFGQMKLGDLAPGEEDTRQTLRGWLDDEISWKGLTPKEKKEGKWVPKQGVKPGDKQTRGTWIAQIRGELKNGDELAEFLTPVFEGANLGMGVLLKHVNLSEEVGYKSRVKLWEKVAEKNLPLMVDYLSKIQFEGEKNPQDRIRPAEWTRGEEGSEERKEGDKKWSEFKKRIMLDHAWKLKRASGSAVLERSPLESSDPELYLRAQEEQIINSVREQGKALAPHLADIVFPYLPFMNDVPFDLLDYRGPGETFYTRRAKGDLASYASAEEAATKIMDNPGGIGAEKAIEHFHDIERGIEMPSGAVDAQERVYPMFSAWLEFVETTPGQRQLIYKTMNQLLRKPTSIAQKWAGMDAESFDEHQMAKILETANQTGILSHDLYLEMKEKKNLTLFWIMWALFRDFILMTPAVAVWEIGKKSALAKAA